MLPPIRSKLTVLTLTVLPVYDLRSLALLLSDTQLYRPTITLNHA
ncbi:MAG: hypothetical protein V7K67_21540 [Nostoc sp.]